MFDKDNCLVSAAAEMPHGFLNLFLLPVQTLPHHDELVPELKVGPWFEV